MSKNESIYFNQLDGVRCFAVISVLISHWVLNPIVEKIPFGSMGVNLFFVLSGFLISRILFLSKEKLDENYGIYQALKSFYFRRTLRIFPIYYILLFILLIINFENVRELFSWLFTYTFNIKFSLPNVWESKFVGSFDHLWSLSVEEQFYIFYPILIFIFPFHRLKTLIHILILVGLASRMVILHFDFPINSVYVFTTTCFDSFGIGALLAYMFLYDHDKLNRILNNSKYFIISVIIFISALVISKLFIVNYKECRTILERFLFSVTCFWIVGWGVINSYSGWFKNIVELKIVIYIGKISYGLYLYHNFIGNISIIKNHRFFHSSTGDNLAKAFIFFIITFLVSTISFYIIENPINKLKHKIS